MAVRIPCVVTDVGDSGKLIGSTGWVVDPNLHTKLAEGMIMTLLISQDELNERGRHARRRVAELYSVEAIISLYEQLYLKLISR